MGKENQGMGLLNATGAPVTHRRSYGLNLPNSVHDVSVAAPPDWEEKLRHISPITTKFSHLRFYWYRAKARWVLYDCVPRCLIADDELQGGMITGRELIALLEGPAPRDLHPDKVSPYVSDVQHEFYRLHKVYARPFWVLQGDMGGHQVSFTPWQRNVLSARRLSTDAPEIGSLDACPFDLRTIAKLNHLNRLHQLEDSVEKLERSGSREYADAELAKVTREIRDAEMEFVVSQVTEATEMSMALGRESHMEGHLIETVPGTAARAKDALAEYRETGDYSL